MDAKINGYKIIAIVAVVYGLFSCTQNANSTSDPEVLAKLDAIEAQLDVLMSDIGEVQTAVGSAPIGQRRCTIEEVLAEHYSDCNPDSLPDEVAVSATYCIEQGRSGTLGAAFQIEPDIEVELGGGWPNVIWGKLTGKAKIPPVIGSPPFLVALPNELSATGETSLGRGLSICVDIPVKALDPSGIAQVHDLVRGVNVESGKYARRTGRVLNYAARRTPIANADAARDVIFDSIPFEDAEDSFDRAETAIERMIAGNFSLNSMSGTGVFGDAVFHDLASALDVPQPALDTIADPLRIFGAMQLIGQSQILSTCDLHGITPEIRQRFPALENQCDRYGVYPNISNTLNVAGRVGNMLSAIDLKSFICDNVTLSVLWSDCD